MSFYRGLILVLCCFLLQACASTMMTQQLQAGKVSFSDSNYKKAFHQLLPVAAYGNREAQYAVGYMYYYGYGVTRDTESGLFWMRQSAAQHYIPAIRALELICRGAPTCELDEGREKAYSASYYKDDHRVSTCDPGRTWSNRPAPVVPASEIMYPQHQVKPAPVIYQQSSAKPLTVEELRSQPAALFREQHEVQAASSASTNKSYVPVPKTTLPRIAQTNSDTYALQVYGAFKLAHVKNVQNELGSPSETRVWHTKNQSKDWYVLTYGSYPSIADARLARDTLPSKVNDLEPWVRRLDRLERV